MPSALLRLELLLKAPVADLGAICEAIRADIGLSVGMLRLSNSEGDMPQRLQDLVLYLGRDELRTWVRDRALLGPACRTARAGMADLTRRSRLIARAAEVMAGFVDGVNREEAYFGGLLHNLGALPEVSGWRTSASDQVQAGLQLARSWELPPYVLDAIEPVREGKPVSPLGRIVSAAIEWTEGVERSLRAGDDSHLQVAWSRSIVERWLPFVTEAEAASMFEYLDSCVEPWQSRH